MKISLSLDWTRQSSEEHDSYTCRSPKDLEKPVIDPCNENRRLPDDWLVVCGGFEERSVGALERALTRGVPFNVLLIRYEPAVAANKSESIHSLCEAKGINIVELKYNRQDPAGFGTVITKETTDFLCSTFH